MKSKTKKKINRKFIKGAEISIATLLGLQVVGAALIPSMMHRGHAEENGEAIANASGRATAKIDGISVSLDQELNDNGDGTYTLSLKSSSNLKYEDLSVKKTKVQYGFYQASQAGQYMIEIWGGNGGGGQDTKYSHGGQGGKGGHIYAVINLDADDVLFYTIGGDGQRTLSNNTGGGANGDGGDHGDNGSYYVGGGGGYTAVYQFKGEEQVSYFKNNYLDEDGKLKRTTVIEEDRVSKYVMIAGGGGGGGAGNAFTINDKAIRTPDGGAAGDLSSPHGVLSGIEYPVQGTFYSGSNGFSSGTKEDFVGRGGSEKPGEIISTFLEFFSGKEPNDWEGTNNREFPGGSGGSGNLRGGAGGAGFAGGSGGIMAGLFVGNNVGGGGGGSSFIASSLSAPTAEQMKYVSGTNISDTGGAFYISYMPTAGSYEYLGNMDLEGEISKYFDIIYDECDLDGDKTKISFTGNKFSAKGVKSMPASSLEPGQSSILKLKVRPKASFIGGNDVPLYTTNELTYHYKKDAIEKSLPVEAIERCSYVNVPYQFKLETHSYTKTGSVSEPCTDLKANDLFSDQHYIESWQAKELGFDFISSVTDYSIKSGDRSYTKTEVLSLTESKLFTISFTVTPKEGSKAVVGNKLHEKTFTRNAKVTIISAEVDNLNGNEMKYNKTLNYDAQTGNYLFTINAQASFGRSETKKFTSGSGSFTIEENGFYYLQAWGSAGGEGGAPYSSGSTSDPSAGGYVGEWLFLKAGDVVSYLVGSRPEPAHKARYLLAYGDQGFGGNGSVVYINDIPIIGAAGGGGGGGGAASRGDAANPVNNNTHTTTFSLDTLQGTAKTEKRNERNGGDGGTNYKNDTLINENHGSRAVPSYTQKQSDYNNSRSAGAIYISQLSSPEQFSGFGTKSNFTENFEIVDVRVDGHDTSATPVISHDKTTVTGIKLKTSKTDNVESGSFSVTYTLKPSATCLGGNDIKLLTSSELTQTDFDSFSGNDKITIPAQDATDYANVRINSDLLNQFSLETHDVDLVHGVDENEGVNVSDLYTASTTFTPNEKLTIKEASSSFESSTVNPEQTTDYAVTYGISPVTSENPKAVVGPTLEPLLIQQNARVSVHNALTYNLTDIEVDAPVETINGAQYYTFNAGHDYEASFKATVGMELPAELEVLIDDMPSQTATFVTRSADTKVLTISGSELTSNSKVVISGSAKERTFNLHYLVSIDATGYVTRDHIIELKAGVNGEEFQSALQSLLNQYPVDEAPVFEGYTFVIEYPDGVPLTEMPAYDVWINGCYHPDAHSLTINYVDSSGNPVAPAYVEDTSTCYNKKEIDITSPTVNGYAPLEVRSDSPTGARFNANAARVQFTMPNRDVTLYVVYQSLNNSVVVNYTSKDNISLPPTYSESGTEGSPYYIESPTITGYVPSISVVEGTYSPEGASYIVNYSPLMYTIQFDSDNGCAPEDEFAPRNVFYGHEIGYTGEDYESSTFIPLPTPVRVGYEFKGWLLNGFVVNGLTKYDLEEGATLKALWEKATYSVTIRYFFDDDSGNQPLPNEVVLNGIYGDTYEYTNPVIEGYHLPDNQLTITGTFIASNIFIDLTYEINSHTITVKYVDSLGQEMFETQTYENVKYNSEYNILLDSAHMDPRYTVNPESGRYSGNMPDEDLELVFVYTLITTPVTPQNCEITFNPARGEYTGSDLNPTPIVKVNGLELVEERDYDVVFPSDMTTSGDKIVTFNFKGNFSGTMTTTFSIDPMNIPLNRLDIEDISGGTYVYTGQEIKPQPVVKLDETPLIFGQDFIYVYDNNIDAGNASVTVSFIGNYANTPDQMQTFTIIPKEIPESQFTITGIEDEVPFTGEKYEPLPTITYTDAGGDEHTLVKNVDYVLFYDENTHAGEAGLTIRFINNYDGSPDIHKTFTILPVEIDFNNLDISGIDEEGYIYDGTAQEPELHLEYNGVTLNEGVDFEVTYEDNIHVSTEDNHPTAIIHFINDYADNPDFEKEFTIKSKVVDNPLNDLEITPFPDEDNPIVRPQTNGQPDLNPITIVDPETGKELRQPEDFEIVFDDDEHAHIEFKGDYEDTLDVEIFFEIKPVVVSDIEDQPYTGEQIKPEINVSFNDEPLTEGVDYTVEYGQNDETGTGTVIITLIGDYADVVPNPIVKEFTISVNTIDARDLVIGHVDPMEYDGEQKCPEPSVTYNGVVLTAGVDFDYVYGENIHAGEGAGKVTIVLKGGFASDNVKVVYFDITAKKIDNPLDDLEITPFPDEDDPIVRPQTSGQPDLNPITIVDPETGEELRQPEDFEIVFDDDEHAHIEFKGDYDGTPDVEIFFEIKPVVVSDIEDQPYTGEQIKPEVNVSFNDEPLTEGVDYTVEYGQNDETGTGTVIITLIGDYADVVPNPIVKEFEIIVNQIDENDLEVESVSAVTFDNTSHKPEPAVTYNGVVLTAGVDFDYVYGENIHAGEGAGIVTIVLKGGFASDNDKVVYFDINAKEITNPLEELEITPFPDEDDPIVRPQTSGQPDLNPITIVDSETGEELRQPEDFEIVFDDDEHAHIEFKGDYDGTPDVELFFEIVPVIVADIDEQPYSGTQITPDIDVSWNGTPLIEGVDYTVTYGPNEDLGTGSVTITLIGDYADAAPNPIVKDFEIIVNEIDIADIVVDYISSVEFNGEQHCPEPNVYYNNIALTVGVDFDYIYGENIHAGEAAGKVTIVMKGGFSCDDDKVIYFDITPKSTDSESFDITPTSTPDNPIEIPENGAPVDPRPIEIIDEETGHELVENEDYTLEIDEDNGEIIIHFINDYEGSEPITEYFEKVPGDAGDHLIYDDIDDQPFDPDGNYPVPEIFTETKQLVEGEDYTLEYFEDEQTGAHEVIVHFIGMFEETDDLHLPYNIVPKDISDTAHISFETSSVPFGGEAVEPTVIVKDGDRVLEEDIDYIVYYANNTKPGQGEAIVQFIGNYATTSTMTAYFDIRAISLSNAPSATGTATVIVSYSEGFDPDITLTAVLREKVSQEVKDQAKLGGRFYGTFGDYEIKLLDKDGNEIQPSSIKEGTVLELRIKLPDELKGRDVKIVHIHNADDVSLIVRGDKAGIGTYIIDEEGYMVTLVNKFSDFSLIYEETCLAHWFLITAAILDILLIVAVVMMGKKQSKALGISATIWLVLMSAVGGIFAHCMLCYVMLGINGALFIFNILFFAFFKGKGGDNVPQQPQVVYVQTPVQAAPVAQPVAAPTNEPAPSVQTNDENDALSLKESMAKATLLNAEVKMSKALIAEYLNRTYGNKVVVNTRENMTSTGLPLADTHYIYLGENKKCFIYVYEVNNSCFAIIRSDNETALNVRQNGHPFALSAFPKTRDYATWYTMLFDSSYKSNEEVFETLTYVINRLLGEKLTAPIPVMSEPQSDLSLKESMAEAKASISKAEINKANVAEWLKATYGERVIVNTRGNMTSTGLPLADTHYIYLGENKKCFIYVYDVDGKCFFIIRSDDETAKEVRASGHKFVSSAFPKTRDYAKWYTMLIDDSYVSNENVFTTLKYVIDRLSGDTPASLVKVAPVSEDRPVITETKANLSLKESMAEAEESSSRTQINKQVLAEWLKGTYADLVEVNTRENITSTGLPLADTHYIYIGDDKKCFIYVYEISGKCFCIIRSDENTAKEIRQYGHPFISSAFPKTRDYANWYTMLIDDSYKTNEEVFEIIKTVIFNLLFKENKKESAARVPVEAVKNEEPVAPAQAEIVVNEEPIKEDLSLKESMAEAKASASKAEITKLNVAEYLRKTYGDQVVVNTRANMTSTGLPLGDTHYLYIGENKKCFIYVYDVDGKVFFIVRGNEEIAKEVRASGHKFVSSAFPKTRDYAKWYTILIDDSYKSNEEVFKTLDKVINGLRGGEKVAVQEEPVKSELSLKEAISEAKETSAVVEINKQVVGEYLAKKYGEKVVVNTRANMTSTGLPLGDTHYLYIGENKKCFIYVYDVDGKVFFIVRGNEEIAKNVRQLGHKFISSAFPKTRDYAKWYTMLIDDSYKSNDDIFKAIDTVIEGLLK